MRLVLRNSGLNLLHKRCTMGRFVWNCMYDGSTVSCKDWRANYTIPPMEISLTVRCLWMRFKDELGRDEAWDFLLEFKWFNDLQVWLFFFLVKPRGTAYCCWRVAQWFTGVCMCVFLFFGSNQEVQATVVGGLNVSLSPFLSIDRWAEPQRWSNHLYPRFGEGETSLIACWMEDKFWSLADYLGHYRRDLLMLG